jgi:hypothetical protein
MPAVTTRPRLVVLIAIPTAIAIALGGISVVGSWRSAAAYQRTENLAILTAKVTQLTFDVEAERDAIVSYIAFGNTGRAALTGGDKDPADLASAKSELQVATRLIASTSRSVKIVDAGVAQIGSGYSAEVRAVTAAVSSKLAGLPGLRRIALTTQMQASNVIDEYDSVILTLLAFDDQVALSSDPQLTSTARAMAQIARVEDADSVERAVIMYGLIARSLDANLFGALTASVAQNAADNNDLASFATTGQITVYRNDLAPSIQDRVISDSNQVIANRNSISTLPIVPADWYGAVSNVILGVHNFEEYLAASAVNRASELHKRAIISAIVVGSLILLVLLFPLLFTLFAGRFTVRPLRRRRVQSQNPVPAI